MRLPRLRFTLRPMMITVAVITGIAPPAVPSRSLRADESVQPGLQGPDDDKPDEEVPPQPMALVEEEAFQAWLFGRETPAEVRARLDALLIARVEWADRMVGMTPAQEEKLRLAGRGDLKRLFDRAEEAQKEFLLVRTDLEELVEFRDRQRPLRAMIESGPFGEGSIYFKVLRKIIDKEQLAERNPN